MSLQSLIQEVPGGLSRYRPTLTYLLLDESRHPLEDVAPGNLVDMIFRLQQSKTPADVRKVVQELIGWLTEWGQACFIVLCQESRFRIHFIGLCLEFTARYAGLADDGQGRNSFQFLVIRHRDGGRSRSRSRSLG